jgi:hypothetical protein
MVNSVVDVLLERGSRQRLGGLPSGDYLVHVLSSFGIGVGMASYVFFRHSAPLPAPVGMMAWQVYGMLVVGSVIFIVEAALFGSVLARRRVTMPVRSHDDDPRLHSVAVGLWTSTIAQRLSNCCRAV